MNRISKNTMYLLDRLVAMARPPEPVILSGFWRSGTTWLQQMTAEAIQAKTIFEPLDRDSLIPFLRGKSVSYRGYIPGTPKDLNATDWQSLDLAFQGVSPHRSGFCYLCRDGIHDSLRPRLVVKLVRGQMMLGDLITRYDPAAVFHISRHPIAVVQSMQQTNWNWSFEDICFSEWYGERIPQMPPGIKRLAKARLQHSHQKIAALWAVTEQAALKEKAIVTCRYESLVMQPEMTFSRMMQSTGLPLKQVPDFGKESPVTIAQRKGISVAERLTSWRKDMPKEVQVDICAVLTDFWPDIGNEWDLV